MGNSIPALKKVFFFCLTALLLAPGAFAQDAPYSAIVLDISGKATATRQGTQRPLELGALLYPREVVETAPGASLTVNYLESGDEEQWPGEMKFTVGQARSDPLHPRVKRMNRKVALPSLNYPSGGTTLMNLPEEGPPGGLKLRGRPPDKEPKDLSPGPPPAAAPSAIRVKCLANSATLENRPPFSWNAVSGADLYQVILYPLGQNQPLWQQALKETEMTYPQKEPPLGPGRNYLWEVEARKGGKVIARQRSCFSLLGEKEAAGLRLHHQKFAEQLAANPADTPTRLAFIFFLEDHRLYDEAAAQYAVLRTGGKESGTLKKREALLLEMRMAPCGLTP
jgi:hypothetical protein